MIVNTTRGGLEFSFNDRNVIAVSKSITGEGCEVTLHGAPRITDIDMPYEEAIKIFEESLYRDPYNDRPAPKSSQKKFPFVQIGENKFRVDIRTSEYEDGISNSLVLYTTFLVSDDRLKKFIECVIGVEDFNYFSKNKYDAHINLGKLFDAEKVRENVERKVREYLSA